MNKEAKAEESKSGKRGIRVEIIRERIFLNRLPSPAFVW